MAVRDFVAAFAKNADSAVETRLFGEGGYTPNATDSCTVIRTGPCPRGEDGQVRALLVGHLRKKARKSRN
jgi:hypothetical protein